MSVLKVVTIGDPILREKAITVKNFNANLSRLIDNMAETMVEYDGVGLAAPQIGIPKRVVVIDIGEGLIELVNPELVESKGEQFGQEGCLSVPGEYADIRRAKYAKVKAQDRSGKEVFAEGEDLMARALLHELDHLNGILFVDKIEN